MKRQPEPVVNSREYIDVQCGECGRTVHQTSTGAFPWHVTDPSQWRGTWCGGSGKPVG